MKKFIIDSIPLIAGITIALILTDLCAGGCKNEDSALSETPEASQFEFNLSKNETSDDEIIIDDSSNIGETVLEETETDLIEETPPTDTSSEIIDEFDYIPMSKPLRNHVKLVSSFYGFDEELIYQIIYIESRFNPTAYNGNCVGLMQVHTGYSKEYLKIEDGLPFEINEDSDVYDPYVNIIIGVRALNDWRRMGSNRGFDELNDWLCYYNMGWKYEDRGSNGYDQLVLGTDLSSIDFSKYKIVE